MSRHEEDMILAERCMAGDTDAWQAIGAKRDAIINYLVHKGTSVSEAKQTFETLLTDCFVKPGDDKACLLKHYHGRGSLKQWLSTVTLNRIIDQRRRERRYQPMEDPEKGSQEVAEAPALTDPTPSPGPLDDARTIVAECFREALESLPIEDRLIIALIYMHGIRQGEVARCFGCSASTISRSVQRSTDHLRTLTLQQINRREPWLDLSWPDVLSLATVVRKWTF